jgi:hypothetical protein
VPRFGHGLGHPAVAGSVEQRVGAGRIAVEDFHERRVAGVGKRRAEEILGPERAVDEAAQRRAALLDGRGQVGRGVDRQEQ